MLQNGLECILPCGARYDTNVKKKLNVIGQKLLELFIAAPEASEIFLLKKLPFIINQNLSVKKAYALNIWGVIKILIESLALKDNELIEGNDLGNHFPRWTLLVFSDHKNVFFRFYSSLAMLA